MRRTSILLAAASATLLLVSACSSSTATKASTIAPSTTAAKAVDTTAAATNDTAGPTTTAPPLVASGSHKDDPFCVAAVAFNNASSPFNDPNATADDYKKYFATVITPGIATLRANEPAELKADADVVTNAFEQLGKVFEANNWDVNKTASDSDLNALLNGKPFADASNNLSTYCGFGG